MPRKGLSNLDNNVCENAMSLPASLSAHGRGNRARESSRRANSEGELERKVKA